MSVMTLLLGLALFSFGGSATALSAAIVFVLCERSYAAGTTSGVLRMALFAEAMLVATTGFLGDSLVYGRDHYAW